MYTSCILLFGLLQCLCQFPPDESQREQRRAQAANNRHPVELQLVRLRSVDNLTEEGGLLLGILMICTGRKDLGTHADGVVRVDFKNPSESVPEETTGMQVCICFWECNVPFRFIWPTFSVLSIVYFCVPYTEGYYNHGRQRKN
ncbi:MAG: hypothetical protein EOM12_08120 [Verrucomicrobiae bacterium]|nr:hypothetical protein [Verrucomicrobiae bacterium]